MRINKKRQDLILQMYFEGLEIEDLACIANVSEKTIEGIINADNTRCKRELVGYFKELKKLFV